MKVVTWVGAATIAIFAVFGILSFFGVISVHWKVENAGWQPVAEQGYRDYHPSIRGDNRDHLPSNWRVIDR